MPVMYTVPKHCRTSHQRFAEGPPLSTRALLLRGGTVTLLRKAAVYLVLAVMALIATLLLLVGFALVLTNTVQF
jgi:hypothetical protein